MSTAEMGARPELVGDDKRRLDALAELGPDAASDGDVAWLESLAAGTPRTTDAKLNKMRATALLREWRTPEPEPTAAAAAAEVVPIERGRRVTEGPSQGLPRDAAPLSRVEVLDHAMGLHARDSEAALLAAIINHPAARDELLGMVEPDDVFDLGHQRIFRALADLHAAGPFDLALLLTKLGERDQLRHLGGGQVVCELAERRVEAGVAERHAANVRKLGERRRLVGALRVTLWDVAEGRVEPSRALDSLAGLTAGQPEPIGGAAGWPAPPGDAVWHGPAGELVRAVAPQTEADPVAMLAQLLVVFGSVLGRTAHWAVGGRRHYCNLFVAIVGPSSIGRKGTALDLAELLLGDLDDAWTSSNPHRGMVSGEGFIHAVRDPDVTDKRALWVEPEFGSVAGVIARDGNNLSGKVREAFDSGNLASASKAEPVRASDAHISIIAHTTFRELRENLSAREYSNGFVNRYMWVCARMSQVLTSGGNLALLDLDEFKRAFGRALTFARSASVMRQAMPLDTESQALWATLYPELVRPRPGVLCEVTARSYVILRRLAVVYAVLDRSRQVRRPHLDAAVELWRYCERSAALIFGDGERDAVTQRVFELMREAGDAGITCYELNRRVFGGRQPESIDRIVRALARQGLAVSEHVKKPRPTEVWRLLV